jgi:hypothetical protein
MTPPTVEKTPHTRLTLRLREDLCDRLAEQPEATEDDRSLNWQINQAVETYLEQRENPSHRVPPRWPSTDSGLRYQAVLTWVMPGFEAHDDEPGTENRITEALAECLRCLERWGAIGEIGVHSIHGIVPSQLPHSIKANGEPEREDEDVPTERLTPTRVGSLFIGSVVRLDGFYWVVDHLEQAKFGGVDVRRLTIKNAGPGGISTKVVYLDVRESIAVANDVPADDIVLGWDREEALSRRLVVQDEGDPRGIVSTRVTDLKVGDSIDIGEMWMVISDIHIVKQAALLDDIDAKTVMSRRMKKDGHPENVYSIAYEDAGGKTGGHIVRSESEFIPCVPA